MNIVECYIFRLVHQKLPGVSTHHLKTLLVLLGKNRHYTLDEIVRITHLSPTQTHKILGELAKTGLVHQDGCLYRQQRLEEIETNA